MPSYRPRPKPRKRRPKREPVPPKDRKWSLRVRTRLDEALEMVALHDGLPVAAVIRQAVYRYCRARLGAVAVSEADAQ